MKTKYTRGLNWIQEFDKEIIEESELTNQEFEREIWKKNLRKLHMEEGMLLFG
jgi:hypothetical protein